MTKAWRNICYTSKARNQRWIDYLRSKGVKAAHPNDGWVKREKKELVFCYPQFNDGAKEGDLVMLGSYSDDPGDTRLVKLMSHRDHWAGNRTWQFEDLTEDEKKNFELGDQKNQDEINDFK